jgi:hypothetical protein
VSEVILYRGAPSTLTAPYFNPSSVSMTPADRSVTVPFEPCPAAFRSLPLPASPASQVNIQYATTGATLYYKDDGNDPSCTCSGWLAGTGSCSGPPICQGWHMLI